MSVWLRESNKSRPTVIAVLIPAVKSIYQCCRSAYSGQQIQQQTDMPHLAHNHLQDPFSRATSQRHLPPPHQQGCAYNRTYTYHVSARDKAEAEVEEVGHQILELVSESLLVVVL